jgi:hypothetical protein
MIPKKVAKKRPLQADYGHYMGLKFGVFWQIKRYFSPDLFPVESDGFTGVFWDGRGGIARGGTVEADSITPVEIPSPCPIFPEKSGSRAEDSGKCAAQQLKILKNERIAG